MDGVDHIFWINLDRCEDRRTSMKNMLSDPCFRGIKTIRIPGLDGSHENLLDYIDSDVEFDNGIGFGGLCAKYHDAKSQYGCLVSHFRAMHTFCNIGSPGQIALIFEDDMTLDFKKYWSKSIRDIVREAPSDWGIIQLSYIVHNIPDTTFTPILYNNTNALYGIGAYIINYEAAREFIDMMYDKKTGKYLFLKSREPEFVYHISDHYIYSFIRGYCYRYPYFTYKYDQPSTVNNSHLHFHNKSRAQIEAFLEGEYVARISSLTIWDCAAFSTFFAAAGTLLWGFGRRFFTP